ncbi:MAG: metallophosphatase [Deltaproteobacteria bacterium]|nr:MAG: metallophosphatase [Deltaproteobacteria bacterium]
MFFIFILIFGSLLTGMNYFVYRYLLLYFFPEKTGAVLIFSVNIFALLYICGLRILKLPDFLNKTGALCLGISFMLFVTAILHKAGDWFIIRKSLPVDQKKRKFLSTCYKGLILGAGTGYLGKGIFNGRSLPFVKSIPVHIKNLSSPLTIVHLTDIHLGIFLQKNFLEDIVNITNKQSPDIVVITGDIIDMQPEDIDDILDPLKQIKARYGVFCVPGNHEYYYGVTGILDKIKKLGVTILGNESRQVAGINIAGVYDLAAFRMKHKLIPDLEAALKDSVPEIPTVLLSHQPKFIHHVKKHHRIDLMLSGHTHAGQIFPFSLLVLLDQPYLKGLYRHDEITQVYVSSGVGFWGPPIRFGAPAEIAVLHLTRD